MKHYLITYYDENDSIMYQEVVECYSEQQAHSHAETTLSIEDYVDYVVESIVIRQV